MLILREISWESPPRGDNDKVSWNNRLRSCRRKKWNYWFRESFSSSAHNLLFCGYRTTFFMLSETFQQLYCKEVREKVSSCLVYFLFYDFHFAEKCETFGGCNNNEFIWYAHKFVEGELRKFKTWARTKIVESMWGSGWKLCAIFFIFSKRLKWNKLNFFCYYTAVVVASVLSEEVSFWHFLMVSRSEKVSN